jgi:uroporphyrinogen-III synthase
MNGQSVAILESRLGEQLAELIAKRGGKPVRAPALAEVPDVDPQRIARLIHEWRTQPVQVAIFQTGVGTRALFKTADALGLTETLLALLAAAVVVVRGPKPTAALRSRNVRIDLSAREPFTTAEVLAELNSLPLAGERVVVQRHGGKNPELDKALQAKGATVIDIPLYRWSLPEDTKPMADLIAALERREIASVVFTSASQAHNLFGLAQSLGKADSLAANLNSTLVASIGPVSTAALAQYGVKAGLEASPPKLGPLVAALDKALSN